MRSEREAALHRLPLKRWTPEEYEALIRADILGKDDRVELLEGAIVQMTPIGPAHTNLVARLNSVLSGAVQGEALVSPQSPLACGAHRPQPDLAVLPLSEDRDDRLPRKALLVVEVADSSLEHDRLKAAIYAAAGVPEYWLVDAAARTVEVHTEPVRRAPARYRTVRVLGEGDTLTSAALPRLACAVSRLFGRRH